MSALSAKTNPRDFLRLYFVVGILTALWGYAFSTCLEADGLKFKLSVALGTSACLAGFIIKMSKLGAKTQQLLLSFVCIANCCVFAYMVWIVMKLPMHPPVAVAQKEECQKDTVMFCSEMAATRSALSNMSSFSTNSSFNFGYNILENFSPRA